MYSMLGNIARSKVGYLESLLGLIGVICRPYPGIRAFGFNDCGCYRAYRKCDSEVLYRNNEAVTMYHGKNTNYNWWALVGWLAGRYCTMTY